MAVENANESRRNASQNEREVRTVQNTDGGIRKVAVGEVNRGKWSLLWKFVRNWCQNQVDCREVLKNYWRGKGETKSLLLKNSENTWS